MTLVFEQHVFHKLFNVVLFVHCLSCCLINFCNSIFATNITENVTELFTRCFRDEKCSHICQNELLLKLTQVLVIFSERIIDNELNVRHLSSKTSLNHSGGNYNLKIGEIWPISTILKVKIIIGNQNPQISQKPILNLWQREKICVIANFFFESTSP